MKKLGKIKLNEFSLAELEDRKLNALKGGCDCGDVCTSGCINCPDIGWGPGFWVGTSIGLSSKDNRFSGNQYIY